MNDDSLRIAKLIDVGFPAGRYSERERLQIHMIVTAALVERDRKIAKLIKEREELKAELTVIDNAENGMG